MVTCINFLLTADCMGGWKDGATLGGTGGVTLYLCKFRRRGNSGAELNETTLATKPSPASHTAPTPPPIQL